MQQLSNKITGDSLTASEWNQVPEEIENVITALGRTLSSGDLNQLGKGVVDYVSGGDFYISTTPVSNNDYILTPLSGLQGADTPYFDGMRIRFVPNAANAAGAVTVNVNGLGVRAAVRQDGSSMPAGQFSTDREVVLIYDANASNFKIKGTTTASETVPGRLEIATQPETDAGTDDTRAITPLKLANSNVGIITGDLANGYVNIGSVQFRYGMESTTLDTSESFSYADPFTNETLSIQITRVSSGNSEIQLPVTTTSNTGFTIDRPNGIEGSSDFYYFAIGR